MSTAVEEASPTIETMASIPLAFCTSKKPPVKRKGHEYEDDEYDETRSVDSEDAGSLVDFIVDDDEQPQIDDSESVSDGPNNEEEARQRDLMASTPPTSSPESVRGARPRSTSKRCSIRTSIAE